MIWEVEDTRIVYLVVSYRSTRSASRCRCAVAAHRCGTVSRPATKRGAGCRSSDITRRRNFHVEVTKTYCNSVRTDRGLAGGGRFGRPDDYVRLRRGAAGDTPR